MPPSGFSSPDPMPTEPHSQKPLASTHLTPVAGDPRITGHPLSSEIPSEVGACGEFLRDGRLVSLGRCPGQFRITAVMWLEAWEEVIVRILFACFPMGDSRTSYTVINSLGWGERPAPLYKVLSGMHVTSRPKLTY